MAFEPDWNGLDSHLPSLPGAFEPPREPADMAVLPARSGCRDSLGATKASTRSTRQKAMTPAMIMCQVCPLGGSARLTFVRRAVLRPVGPRACPRVLRGRQ